jgi:hypothetical protein
MRSTQIDGYNTYKKLNFADKLFSNIKNLDPTAITAATAGCLGKNKNAVDCATGFINALAMWDPTGTLYVLGAFIYPRCPISKNGKKLKI